MAEWIQDYYCGFITFISLQQLRVYQGSQGDVWCMQFAPMMPGGGDLHLTATDAPAAQLEALHIVGEWGKQVAVEAAELRGRMVGAELNAKGAGHDG